jgi:hypothetical protein|tara:strand:- start:1401 stop:1592 length:192 start_codon:yes stop_codon:yes gene_type:complete
MNQAEIQQQIELLSHQVQQRANAIASQDPLISRLTGQIEVYRSFLQSENVMSLDGQEEETENA